jgi:hypothetical protein
MMMRRTIEVQAMSDEDEIWDDKNEPAKSDESYYDAMLVDVEDHSNSYSADVIFASTDADAKAKARQWATEECEMVSVDRALLILTGGSIKGSYSVMIELGS